MTRARILLVDDHDLFREGLAGLINAQTDLQVVGQAHDGLAGLTLARDLRPDLIVMDIKMPICDGLEATRLIRTEMPDARILILTVHDEDEKLFDAIRAGASSYLLKNTSPSEFLHGVRAALEGQAQVPPKLAARLFNEFARLSARVPSNDASVESSDLTPREIEVLNLLATGAADKEIAEQLSLSLHTVKTHVRNILSKLHAINRRDATRLAAKQGLIKKN